MNLVQPAGTLLLEPITTPHEYLDEERQARINVVHRPDRRLVAVLELLSPTNKAGDGCAEYRVKRRAVLEHRVHLVELDLLLGGTRPNHAQTLPDADYFAYISRVDQRPNCQVYAWTLRQALPTIPIPLKMPDHDIHVNLADVFATTYERGRYARSLSYGKRPVAPLKTADAAWAKRISTRK